MNDRPARPAIVLVKSDARYGNSLEAKLPSWRVFAKLKVAGFFIDEFRVLVDQVVFEFRQRLDGVDAFQFRIKCGLNARF